MSNATERAYLYVREQILSGKYAAGSHLREEHIAEDAKVSRTPIREALRRLSTEHLVKFVPNQGAFVLSWEDDDVDSIFDIRIMLEGYSAFRAASRIDDEGIREMEACADDIELLCENHNKENHRKTIEYNHRLHSIIVEAAGSEHLRRLLVSLVEIPMLLKTIDRYSDKDVERSNHHHRELIEAFKAKDGNWARNVMESHLRAGHRIYVSKDLGVEDKE
ncbi:MAG: DNA-binding GntR family transcriptional regulator [Gammaproteobacteria bacterium]|jgi:DNA-binding GntR family transcriptional regulator